MTARLADRSHVCLHCCSVLDSPVHNKNTIFCRPTHTDECTAGQAGPELCGAACTFCRRAICQWSSCGSRAASLVADNDKSICQCLSASSRKVRFLKYKRVGCCLALHVREQADYFRQLLRAPCFIDIVGFPRRRLTSRTALRKDGP